MSKQIARAVEDAAKKAGQGLAHDFADAYHSILKDTEQKTGQVAAHAAENEAKTAADLAKAAEKPGAHTPHEPHAGSGGAPGSHPGEGSPAGAGREQVHDPHEAGRGEDAVCGGGEPVDMATGRMFIDQVDASLPGSLPLLFTRNFESGYRAGRWMGRRWVCTFDERLEIDAEGVVHVRADRVTQAYPHPEPGEPVHASAGDRRVLDVDARGRLYTVTEPGTGLVREFTVQPDGVAALLTRVRDRSGRHYDLEYDGSGTPQAIQHSGGYRLLVSTHEGRITALLLAGAAPDGGDQELLRYGYGEDGNLTEVYNSSGLPMRFDYDAWDRVTSWTDRNNSRYWYVYDSLGRVVDEGGEDGTLRFTFHYGEPDPATGLRVHTETNALGHTTRYTVNDRHQVVAISDPLGNTTHYERDEFNRLLTETDPLGRTTRYEYDGAGDLVTVIRPDGERTTAEYAGELSLPTRITEPGGAVWLQTFDEAGRRTSLTDPLGAVTRYTYDERGHLASVTDALGHVTEVACDPAGLPVSVGDPSGGVATYRRDTFGLPVAVTDPLGNMTHLRWTIEGELTERAAPGGLTERWRYDGEGNVVEYDNGTERATFTYTHFETPASRTGPDGARVGYSHDRHMQLTAVTDALGRTWSYQYDAAGRLVAESDFENRLTSYQLDSAGQVTAVSDPLGNVTAYSYDSLGRIVRKQVNGRETTYQHDAAGRLRRAVNPDSELLRIIDAAGNLISETVNGRTVTYDYDALSRRVRRVTPSGHVTEFEHDATGRPTALRTSGGRMAFEYDTAGRELSRTLGPSLHLVSRWDEAHRLIEQTLQSTASLQGPSPQISTPPLQRRAYAYRADGAVTAIDGPLGQRAFRHDPGGRVTGVEGPSWRESYSYDPCGNLTEADWPATAATQDALGPRSYDSTQLVGAGRVRYERNAAGQLVLRQVTRLSRKPDTWRYTWDADGQLTEATTPDGTRWRYLYDPLGRRIAKLRLGQDGQVVERTNFTWDGEQLAEQTVQAPYLPGPHTLSWDYDGLIPLSQTETIASGGDVNQEQFDRRFFAIITDLVGTPTELVDTATNEVAWRARSTLWGLVTWSPGASGYTPLRFPGQYFDPETRLHYNVNRYYDPETARYASPDPLGLAPADNPDTYVTDPRLWCDPLGLSPHPRGRGGRGGRGGGEPEAPAAVDRSKIPTVRMRHYTNAKGAEGIAASGVVKASDQNKVFLLPAKGKLMSPRDAESTLGIGRGRGNKVLDFDVPADRVSSRYNAKFGITEWVADGDLEVWNITVKR